MLNNAFAITATGGGVVQQVTGVFHRHGGRATGIFNLYGNLGVRPHELLHRPADLDGRPSVTAPGSAGKPLGSLGSAGPDERRRPTSEYAAA